MAMISPLNWLKAFFCLIICFMMILIFKWWSVS